MAELCLHNETESTLTTSLTSSTSSRTSTLFYESCSLCMRKSKNFTCEMCVLKGDFSKAKSKQSEVRY